jgi:hypothetical protein
MDTLLLKVLFINICYVLIFDSTVYSKGIRIILKYILKYILAYYVLQSYIFQH